MRKKPMLLLLGLIIAPAANAFADSQYVLSDMDLAGMASNPYNSGELPLGDRHYVLDAPKKGFIYLCRPMQQGGGAQIAGPWIHGATWNALSKPSVLGSVTWDQAQFNDSIAGDKRTLDGNGLPLNHPTGQFPVAPSDPAFNFDRNPNSIKPQNLRDSLPVNPVYADAPYCMGGEAGIMLTGVPLFNGFDAEMRDAAAHEMQDSCSGHPQAAGEYHYHSLSACIKDIGEKTILGYALDGFPITGPLVAPGRYLTTGNLDECHGITSEIIENGEKKVTYHYVMTQDFPYSVSCFRGKPVRIGPTSKKDDASQESGFQQGDFQQQHPFPNQAMPNQPLLKAQTPPLQNGMKNSPMPPSPPTVALSACFRKNDSAACSFPSPRGDTITGTCHAPPGQTIMACIPQR